MIRSFCSLLPQTKKLWNLPHLRHSGGAMEKWRNPDIGLVCSCADIGLLFNSIHLYYETQQISECCTPEAMQRLPSDQPLPSEL
ncbi:Zinc finger, ZZ type [Musa troglodytarum]|uniref:Zinc finger, ZZ type n=1 Tax=Musa troglodytarum TaxID=320322 RepID=A0A9E7JJU6_9LILI|nr:Zinc finger, ZZ type [Musa troglodytarum]